MKSCRVIMAGTGNASTVLGRLIRRSGHTIVAVAGRQATKTRELANEWDARATSSFDFSGIEADFCILAVADHALYGCGEWLRAGDMATVHTAGSVPMDVLRSVAARFGVLYPLQSLNTNASSLPEVPFLVDGSSGEVKASLFDFAQTLSSDVRTANDAERADHHLAAVFSSNFINHLLALTEDYCRSKGISFSSLNPLVRETIERAFRDSPSNVQTGPAARNDLGTVERQSECLAEMPHLQSIYRIMTRSIRQRHGHDGGQS
jgi:predicted short-subunit dehydrogenase-like oxidoreductase (DUF2520 family)